MDKASLFDGKSWVRVKVIAIISSPLTANPDVVYTLDSDKTQALLCQRLYSNGKPVFRLSQ